MNNITANEFNYLIEATKLFYDEAQIKQPKNLKYHYENLLNNKYIYIDIKINKGFLLGVISPSFLNPEEKQANELALYVNKKSRGTSTAKQLILNFEKEAKKQNCKSLYLCSLEKLEPTKMKRYYNRLGYNLSEYHYKKEF